MAQKIPKNEKFRFIVAVDEQGVHLRRTLCVTHHGETGEVSYDAKPMYSIHNKTIRKRLIELLNSERVK